MANWGAVQTTATTEQLTALVDQAARAMAGLPLAVLRDRRELGARADQAVRDALRSFPGVQSSPVQLQHIVSQVIAKVGGLGFLDALLPPNSTEFTDLALNADGRVWGRRKSGDGKFEDLKLQPTREEAWRALEALLAPEGRACSESTPSVDVKIPRDEVFGFGGARVKALHPCIAPGAGYPTLAIRLFEGAPVPPDRLVRWNVFPQAVVDALLAAVGERLRVLVLGGTATGKTTLLSAICHGVPADERIVKIEDPEEIWLPHPNVVTLEARPAPPGSSVPPYTVADGVDDAMRLAPAYVIVGEVRRGDAALSLFRALMSDHAGLTTFHAASPEHAVKRLSIIMSGDTRTPYGVVKDLFAEAVDLVVQIGWRGGLRTALGIWEVAGVSGEGVKFRQLWRPGDETMLAPTHDRSW